MANALYDFGREGFLAGDIDWDGDNIKIVLVTSGYTVDLATHQHLDDVGAGTRVATSANLGTKTVTDGVADAADVTFTSVTGSVAYAILYADSGVESTSRLIAYFDTITGLPLTVTGADVTLNFSDGADKIFRL